ncbi:MAG TPA: TonB-dependent receptor plug domain-containing protein [Gemmatimonadales bacterium]|nr:TonB-dependent receptor plug domain-containing protein [Gemmatimonadales bacterium]
MASHAHSFILGALCTAAVVACHPRPLTSGMPGPGDKKVITEEMIAHTGASTAWDVLRREEPQMTFRENSNGQPTRMEQRGQTSMVLSDAPLVYVDGARLADYRTLKDIPASTLKRIEILNSIEATTRYGTDAEGGAILIFTKNGSTGS